MRRRLLLAFCVLGAAGLATFWWLTQPTTVALAAVAGVFAEHGVSVSTMRQDDVRDDPRRRPASP